MSLTENVMSLIENAKPLLIALAAFFALLMIFFSIVHQHFVSAMIRAINDNPEHPRNISQNISFTGKFFLVQREYRKLFPERPQARYAWTAFAAAAASNAILFALLISILPKHG